LKKKDRVKKLKLLYEKIKKQIKEKYKLCNLYIKNLPDNFDDDSLRKIFSEFGPIRSCKAVRKELITSYLGVKRALKVFGFVCFFDRKDANNAKTSLHDKKFNNFKLYVDYHQSKKEREEMLKLNMLRENNKPFQKQNFSPQSQGDIPFHPFRSFQHGMPMFSPQMLRKLPQNSYVNVMKQPIQMNMPIHHQQQHPQMFHNDVNSRQDYYGEALFSKLQRINHLSQHYHYFSKIVGIFLELEDHHIQRLISDDNYFIIQVQETLKVN
jgi:RNA recognition motif-containing protein